MAQQAVERKMHPIEDYERHAAEWAQGVLDKAGEAARGQGVACDSVHAADQHASDAILQTVQARGCDGIVMGSHGRRGVARLAMGSAASDVLAGAKTPVIVVR